MLLRSSSTPILNSWIPTSPSTPAEQLDPSFPQIPKLQLQLPKPLTVSPISPITHTTLSRTESVKKMTKALSDTDLISAQLPKKKRHSIDVCYRRIDEGEETGLIKYNGGGEFSVENFFGSPVSGVGGRKNSVDANDKPPKQKLKQKRHSIDICYGKIDQGEARKGKGGGFSVESLFGTPVSGGGGGLPEKFTSVDGGKSSFEAYSSKMIQKNPVSVDGDGGRGGNGSLGGLSWFSEEEESGGGGGGGGEGRKSDTEAYYKTMIEANPGNALILGNYARFLKEVKGDMVKAEEYCGRAVLANPSDANVLALYADLIWQTQRDSSRAEMYFDQAVQAAPDDCYVMASYAKFLWDTEEDEDECEVEEPHSFFQHGQGTLSSVAAAS